MPASQDQGASACPSCARPVQPGSRACAVCGTSLFPRSAKRDPLVGQVVAGRFLVEELVGTGGMGKVYKARHLSLDRSVCIKLLKPALLEDPTLVGRFEREAKAASRLNHPNVIQVIDFGRTEDGGLYIAMEYVPGKDLRSVLRDEWPLDEARLCNIIAQVLSALGEAHAHNVIHRDLKPENIMIEPRRGEGEFVKVLDFGIAKILDSELPGLTRADVVCGTPQYMAPEQATGSQLDNRCDLYAVGVILYQLATGQLPFDGPNSMDVLNKHVNDLPMPPRQRQPNAPISEAMEKLILRALEKDPMDRPQTAEQFRMLALNVTRKVQAEALMEKRTRVLTPLPKTDPLQLAPILPRSRRRGGILAVLAALVAIAIGFAGYRIYQRPMVSEAPPVAEGSTVARRDPAKAKRLVAQASEASGRQDTGGALSLLHEALLLDPDNAEAHYRMASLLLLENRTERAREEYEEAKRLDPTRFTKQVDQILRSL
jgi:eukaryotic-like serine/threonine-protein kinase